MCAWQTDEDAAALERLGRGKAQDLCLLEVLLLFHFDLLYFTLDICTIKNDALGSMACITVCEHYLIAVVSLLYPMARELFARPTRAKTPKYLTIKNSSCKTVRLSCRKIKGINPKRKAKRRWSAVVIS